jgi:hypothetical protein
MFGTVTHLEPQKAWTSFSVRSRMLAGDLQYVLLRRALDFETASLISPDAIRQRWPLSRVQA